MNLLFVILSAHYPISITSRASQAPLKYYWATESGTYVQQTIGVLARGRRHQVNSTNDGAVPVFLLISQSAALLSRLQVPPLLLLSLQMGLLLVDDSF